MRLQGRQFRFVAGTVLGWVAVRAALMVWSGGGVAAIDAGIPAADPSAGHLVARPWTASVTAATPPRAPLLSRVLASVPVRVTSSAAAPALMPMPDRSPIAEKAAIANPMAANPSAPRQESVLPIPSQPAREARASRWSASAYLFTRSGSDRPSLSPSGELGGSQMAARIAYSLNGDRPVRAAVVARFYRPLADAGAEGAIGFDWHPAPALPIRVAVERRVALEHAGRSAWSAYAAGGFYAERKKIVLDGYAQAGVVGTRARDPFADGALRAGRKTALGPASLTVGAGLWGAAQPGLSRLDVGPRAAVVLPVASHDVSAALEGRFRLAGKARPGSGAALTVGVDF